MSEINKREYKAWIASAMLIPVVMSASESAPLPTIGTVLLCLLLGKLPESEPGGLLALIRWCFLSVFLSRLLEITGICWRGRGAEYAVPAALLAMGFLAMRKGTAPAARAAAVLRYGMFAVVVGILISGFGEIGNLPEAMKETKWNLLLPVWLLVPFKGQTKGKAGRIKLLAGGTAIVSSAVTWSVLNKNQNFYTLSKSISMFGAVERYESLASMVITLGVFSAITVLLAQSGENWKWAGLGKQQTGILWAVAASGILYLLPWEIRDLYLAIGAIGFWTLIPAVESVLKKAGKGVDKRGNPW